MLYKTGTFYSSFDVVLQTIVSTAVLRFNNINIQVINQNVSNLYILVVKMFTLTVLNFIRLSNLLADLNMSYRSFLIVSPLGFGFMHSWKFHLWIFTFYKHIVTTNNMNNEQIKRNKAVNIGFIIKLYALWYQGGMFLTKQTEIQTQGINEITLSSLYPTLYVYICCKYKIYRYTCRSL